MESAPTTEAVYQGVYTLYNNSNTVEQEKASKWLEQLQNSVSAQFLFNQNKSVFVEDEYTKWNITILSTLDVALTKKNRLLCSTNRMLYRCVCQPVFHGSKICCR